MDIAPTVTHSIPIELIDAAGAATPIEAELRYDRFDPYAVTAVFRTGSTQVKWVVSRDLIAEGIYEPSGDGDVHVWPCLDTHGRAVVVIELRSPDGEALMQTRSDALTSFIASTDAVVPRGTESLLIDVDAVIDGFLREAG